MANLKISQLSSAAALTGTEEIPVVQNNATVKTTVQDIANLAGGGSTLDVVAVGTLGTSPLNLNYTTQAILSPEEGTQNAPIFQFPTINIYGGMGFSGTLSSISFPTLTAASIQLSGIPTLTTIDLPALETAIYQMMAFFNFQNNASLTTLNISSLVKIPNGQYMYWTGNAFSQATVDHILVRMVATNAINCNLDLSQGTSSAPTATGLADKATLEGRGWTVTTN